MVHLHPSATLSRHIADCLNCFGRALSHRHNRVFSALLRVAAKVHSVSNLSMGHVPFFSPATCNLKKKKQWCWLGLKPTKFEHDVQAKICISTKISIQLLPYTGRHPANPRLRRRLWAAPGRQGGNCCSSSPKSQAAGDCTNQKPGDYHWEILRKGDSTWFNLIQLDSTNLTSEIWKWLWDKPAGLLRWSNRHHSCTIPSFGLGGHAVIASTSHIMKLMQQYIL